MVAAGIWVPAWLNDHARLAAARSWDYVESDPLWHGTVTFMLLIVLRVFAHIIAGGGWVVACMHFLSR